MEDTQAVNRWLAERKPANAVIVGAGFIGLEMAEAMHQRGLKVMLVEKPRMCCLLLMPKWPVRSRKS